MRDEEFLKKYEELLDKGYCDCNEMNCIDNNSPRRILNIVKRLQLEEDDLLKENRELRKKLEKSFSYEEYDYQVNRNIELRKEKQELIEYLKEKIKEYTPNLRVNRCDEQGNIVAQYINPEVFIKQPVEVYKEILNKIEKR